MMCGGQSEVKVPDEEMIEFFSTLEVMICDHL